MKGDNNTDQDDHDCTAQYNCCLPATTDCQRFCPFVTHAGLLPRRSLVRANGEVFVLLYVCLFGQRFLSNPRADARHILHAGVDWVGTCLLHFWGLAAPGGRKRRQMKFSLLWESMGNFCILAVFERYLSNACTDPHQILFV